MRCARWLVWMVWGACPGLGAQTITNLATPQGVTDLTALTQKRMGLEVTAVNADAVSTPEMLADPAVRSMAEEDALSEEGRNPDDRLDGQQWIAGKPQRPVTVTYPEWSGVSPQPQGPVRELWTAGPGKGRGAVGAPGWAARRRFTNIRLGMGGRSETGAGSREGGVPTDALPDGTQIGVVPGSAGMEMPMLFTPGVESASPGVLPDSACGTGWPSPMEERPLFAFEERDSGERKAGGFMDGPHLQPSLTTPPVEKARRRPVDAKDQVRTRPDAAQVLSSERMSDPLAWKSVAGQKHYPK